MHHTGAQRRAALIQHHERIRVNAQFILRLDWPLPFSSSGRRAIACVQSRSAWLQSPAAGSGVYSGEVSTGHELARNGSWSSGLAPASCARRPRLNSQRCWDTPRKIICELNYAARLLGLVA